MARRFSSTRLLRAKGAPNARHHPRPAKFRGRAPALVTEVAPRLPARVDQAPSSIFSSLSTHSCGRPQILPRTVKGLYDFRTKPDYRAQHRVRSKPPPIPSSLDMMCPNPQHTKSTTRTARTSRRVFDTRTFLRYFA